MADIGFRSPLWIMGLGDFTPNINLGFTGLLAFWMGGGGGHAGGVSDAFIPIYHGRRR